MSLVVNKENIFFILPESRYAVSDRIDRWMEEDFTVHLTAKLFPETLKNEQAYMFARNGMHSGISAFKDDFGNCNIVFTYWFKKLDGTMIPKQIIVLLKENELKINSTQNINTAQLIMQNVNVFNSNFGKKCLVFFF